MRELLVAVAGEEAHGLRMAAVGERNAGIRARGERGGDAGNDFERHAVLAQVIDLLAAAAEHERIAALEAHDVFAALRVLDEQLVDLFLRGAAAADELADVESRGIAARELEHFGRNQPVVHDDVGFLQRAQALQRHEPGIAGSGADQHHVAVRNGVRILERLARELFRALVAAGAQRRGHRAGEHPGEKSAARADIGEFALDALAPAIGECGQRAERSVQQCLEPLADQAREHRRGAAGRHRDLHRRAIDDGGHDEAGELAIVDHVAGNARGVRGGGDRGVHRAIVGGGDHQPLAVDVRRFESARDGASPRRVPAASASSVAELRRHDGDHGAGFA